MNGNELRTEYIRYFKGMPGFEHATPPPAPLIPPDDPTVMFTVAGMVQFKRYYSGDIDPLPFSRATTCQPCLRAGGKGSDLENVGKTLRHHTLFEMLGNFSFGDYFKREAVRWAWTFVTEQMGLAPERLFPTIFEEDDEAEAVWREETGALYPAVRLDAKENFWGPAGETGACGPCSELCYFMGSERELREIRAQFARSESEAVAETARRIVEEGDLFLEIWNMVFPQFDQQRDGSRPMLKNRGIDTGAGLERMTTAMMHGEGKASTPYETDLMAPIVAAAAGLLGTEYIRVAEGRERFASELAAIERAAEEHHPGLAEKLDEKLGAKWRQLSAFESFEHQDYHHVLKAIGAPGELSDGLLGLRRDYVAAADARLAVNAIADHSRALVFCLNQGMTPGNIGRGYVIRRIQRRALRFASLLGKDEAFMDQLVDPVIEAMGGAYPALKGKADFARKAIRIEEESFLRTRNRGMKLLDEQVREAVERGDKRIPGAEAFKLWDTFGFPVDMTREIAADHGVTIDDKGYAEALEEQKERGRASWRGADLDKEAELADQVADEHGETAFVGYDRTDEEPCRVLAIIRDGGFAGRIEAGEKATVILDRTPFYAEAGGQVGDTGQLLESRDSTFDVHDTQKTGRGVYLHWGELQAGVLAVGTNVLARVDAGRRMDIRRHHSATHLLQAALKKFVGEHTTQAGSWVGPEALRFDFTHPEAVSGELLKRVQAEVNRLILEDLPVKTEVLPLEEARERGAIAPFGEKYGPTVRVVQMGTGEHKASLEFCGGTHLGHTGQAGRFRIVSEGSIASGVRRIEAVVGGAAVGRELEEQYDVVLPLQAQLAAKGPELLDRVEQLASRVKHLEKELARERQKAATANLGQYAEKAVDVAGCKLATAVVEGLGGNELRALAFGIRDLLGPKGIVVAVSQGGGKCALLAACGTEAQEVLPAGTVLKAVAEPLGGKGGGKKDVAQGGAKGGGNVQEVLDGLPGRLSADSV